MRRTHYIVAAALVLVPANAAVAGDAAGVPGFVPMNEIVVPIVDGPRAYGRLRVTIVLMVRDAAAVASVQVRMPALRETALIAAAEYARLHASPFAPVDAGRLSKDLSAAIAAHDPEHVISRALLVRISAERS